MPWLGQDGWAARSTDPLISASLVLGSQVCIFVPDFVHGFHAEGLVFTQQAPYSLNSLQPLWSAFHTQQKQTSSHCTEWAIALSKKTFAGSAVHAAGFFTLACLLLWATPGRDTCAYSSHRHILRTSRSGPMASTPELPVTISTVPLKITMQHCRHYIRMTFSFYQASKKTLFPVGMVVGGCICMG